ncbi:MAG TPA: hypothetical protein VL943_14735, partial [Niabella sp.]|nr:hypothetical protein [Niabella sp.]
IFALLPQMNKYEFIAIICLNVKLKINEIFALTCRWVRSNANELYGKTYKGAGLSRQFVALCCY